ncbi:MAG TPA: molybdopterin oxidoreductase, partial [Ruminococcaceae bacterium]|nr:molybdopterin oxidoreductase [Oscillospiraceae bacterium]
MVITAIGQKPALAGLEALETTGWGTIAAGEQNFLTNLEGVFAAGDATNNGADIAVTAIGEAKKAAEMAGRYLNGEPLSYEPPFLVKSEKTAEDFADRAKEPRIEAPVRPAGERRRDFAEVAPVMTERQAQAEASRCLECGCMDYFECRLVDYANKYRVRPGKYGGKIHRRKAETTHPNINREPEKCVLCGMCVRICEETVGACALGLLGRGFDTAVTPALEQPLENTDCIACGMCAAVCPVGAITEKTMAAKQTPLSEDVTETVCPFCSVGCRMELTTKGELILRALPCEKDGGLLCKKGRFGFGDSGEAARVSVPMLRRGGKLEQTDLEQAGAYVTDKFKSINDRYGSGSVAAAISCGYTNEEALAVMDYAEKELGVKEVFCFGQAAEGLSEVLSRDASSAGWDELKAAEWIVAVSPDDIMENYAVAGMRIRQAV